ncbi:DUF2514 family protein [Enterococcus faecalis]|uniref:DUF2514 family protein n=1 Tax=Enterococcus faecalis TaxID=1351 RepID=UPI003D965228
MIWAFAKAYWKQLVIMAMLAVLVISGVVAWNAHGSRQYDAGYAQAKEDRKAEDEIVRQHYEQEKSINEREAQQRIDQARNDALDAAARAGRLRHSLPSVSSSGSITPLSALGRQPQTPEFCLPTCSANLSRETDNWQSMLTGSRSRKSLRKTIRHPDQIAWHFSWDRFPVTVYKTVLEK